MTRRCTVLLRRNQSRTTKVLRAGQVYKISPPPTHTHHSLHRTLDVCTRRLIRRLFGAFKTFAPGKQIPVPVFSSYDWSEIAKPYTPSGPRAEIYMKTDSHMKSSALPLVRLALYVSGLVTEKYLSKLISNRLSTDALLAR